MTEKKAPLQKPEVNPPIAATSPDLMKPQKTPVTSTPALETNPRLALMAVLCDFGLSQFQATESLRNIDIATADEILKGSPTSENEFLRLKQSIRKRGS